MPNPSSGVERLPCPRCGRQLNFSATDRIPQHNRWDTGEPCTHGSGRNLTPAPVPLSSRILRVPNPADPELRKEIRRLKEELRSATRPVRPGAESRLHTQIRQLHNSLRRTEQELARWKAVATVPLPYVPEPECSIQINDTIYEVPDIQY